MNPVSTVFALLLKREIINIKRNPEIIMARMMQVIDYALILALFLAPLKNNYEAIQSRLVSHLSSPAILHTYPPRLTLPGPSPGLYSRDKPPLVRRHAPKSRRLTPLPPRLPLRAPRRLLHPPDRPPLLHRPRDTLHPALLPPLWRLRRLRPKRGKHHPLLLRRRSKLLLHRHDQQKREYRLLCAL